MLFFPSERLETFRSGASLVAMGVPGLHAPLVTTTKWIVRIAGRVAKTDAVERRAGALRELQSALSSIPAPTAPDQVLRILRARDLLLSGRRQIDVAHELNFSDENHFIRHFRRVLGMTPGAYRRAAFAAVAAMALVLVGCAGSMPTKRYTAVTLNVGLPANVMHELVAEHVGHMGWKIVENDGAGRIVAETPTDVLEETVTRERWTFVTRGGHLSVERRFEARFERNGDWKAADAVCDTYGYTRERQVAASLSVAISQKWLARVGSSGSVSTLAME